MTALKKIEKSELSITSIGEFVDSYNQLIVSNNNLSKEIEYLKARLNCLENLEGYYPLRVIGESFPISMNDLQLPRLLRALGVMSKKGSVNKLNDNYITNKYNLLAINDVNGHKIYDAKAIKEIVINEISRYGYYERFNELIDNNDWEFIIRRIELDNEEKNAKLKNDNRRRLFKRMI